MTVILGRVEKGLNGGVTLAADSQCTAGNRVEQTTKIYKKNDFLIAFTGHVSVHELFKYKVGFPTEQQIKDLDISIDKKFMVTQVRPALRQMEKELEIAKPMNCLIIAYKNKLFSVASFGDVMEFKEGEFCSAGCGDLFAKCKADTMAKYTKLNTKQIIIESMKYAIKNDAFCGLPIKMSNTIDKELIEIYGDNSEEIIQWEEI